MTPYLAFDFWTAASLTPCLQHRSAPQIPTSRPFRRAIIWQSPPESKGVLMWNFLGQRHEEIQMKMTRYSELQILAILRQAEGGVLPLGECCAFDCRATGYGALP